jgi:hypothetical protein
MVVFTVVVNGSAASSHTRSSSSSAGTGRPFAASRHSSTASSLVVSGSRRPARTATRRAGSRLRSPCSRLAGSGEAAPAQGPDAGHQFDCLAKTLGHPYRPDAIDSLSDMPLDPVTLLSRTACAEPDNRVHRHACCSESQCPGPNRHAHFDTARHLPCRSLKSRELICQYITLRAAAGLDGTFAIARVGSG